MTKDELMKYFSHRRYNEIRKDILRVMQERPDLTEAYPIEAAADQIAECRTNGVEITVDDAVRLTEKSEPVSMEELLRRMDAVGITDENILETIASIDLGAEDYEGCAPSRRAARKMEFLNKHADELASGNRDIIVIARPEFFRYADYAVLHLAVFCPTLTKVEQNIIQVMKQLSDGVKMSDEKNWLKLIFYINNIWEQP